jgi:predicted TIM-barrel fold metal-dependent hydrolase
VPRRASEEAAVRISVCAIAAVFDWIAVRHLAAQVGSSQIVMGSDYPYQWQLHPADHILGCSFLSDDEKAGMLGGTAVKLLNLQA